MKMYVANSTGGLMLQTMLYLANQTSRAAVNTLVDLPPAPKSDINEVKCYGVYGCFPINGPWTTVTRQINVHPQRPADIAPTFTAYTTPAFDRPLLLDLNDADSVRRADIANVAGGRIFVLAHGYLESGEMPWMLEMGKTLLGREPPGRAVVILVDWGGGSSPPYVQAVANIRLVGAITAHVIHMLYEELALPDVRNVHMIGHSLGAHLAGYAGHHLQRDFGLKVGRITGLDPAAPLFSETEAIVRLDRGDAHFVDIIHTDASPLIKGGLGIHQRVGHVDFYPNGGFDNPGCDVRLQEYMRNRKVSLLATMQQFLGCNHIRSYQFFVESITSACPFMGIACDTFEDFAEGKCMQCGHAGHHCIRMGYHSAEDYERLRNEGGGAIAVNGPLVLYLMTGERRPFCRIHYKLTVRIAGHDESNLHGGEVGSLSLQLHGAGSRSLSGERMPFSDKPMYFEPGCEYSALVPGKDLHDPAYASVYWEYQTNLLNPLTWRIHASPRIFLDYVRVQSLESDVDLKLCPQHQNAILSGTRNILRTAHCTSP